MGWFSRKKLLRDDHVMKLGALAKEGWSFFPGSLEGAVLSYQGAEINFLDESDRNKFQESISLILRDIANSSRPMIAWRSKYSEISKNSDRFVIASVLVAKTVVILEALAEAELQFPQDNRISQLREKLMVEVFTAFSRYYGDGFGAEITCEFPHIAKVMLGPFADD